MVYTPGFTEMCRTASDQYIQSLSSSNSVNLNQVNLFFANGSLMSIYLVEPLFKLLELIP
jgi:hypothetical protein